MDPCHSGSETVFRHGNDAPRVRQDTEGKLGTLGVEVRNNAAVRLASQRYNANKPSTTLPFLEAPNTTGSEPCSKDPGRTGDSRTFSTTKTCSRPGTRSRVSAKKRPCVNGAARTTSSCRIELREANHTIHHQGSVIRGTVAPRVRSRRRTVETPQHVAPRGPIHRETLGPTIDPSIRVQR